jgi:hypothetical protein
VIASGFTKSVLVLSMSPGAVQLLRADAVQRVPGRGAAEGFAAAGAVHLRARGDARRFRAAGAAQRARRPASRTS